jgi:hypothetical protein
MHPRDASAGMPSFTLADVRRSLSLSNLTRMRLEVISFFLLSILLCAGIIQLIWNSLRRDFPILPRLSYGKALGVVTLWGLLFVLVLTMISGARELMTPGAWEKRGLTYQLAQDPGQDVESQIAARVRAIERLADALKQYAQTHGKNLPASDSSPEIPAPLWQHPVNTGQRYVYVGGRWDDNEFSYRSSPVAYEPDEVGPDRLVVLADGSIVWMPVSEIKKVLSQSKP